MKLMRNTKQVCKKEGYNLSHEYFFVAPILKKIDDNIIGFVLLK